MSLILLGQPELQRVLRMQIYEAIAQKVNIRFHLPGMDPGETAGYWRYSLTSPPECGYTVFSDNRS